MASGFDITTIKQALYDWATPQAGLPVIWLYQKGPKPTKPFITLNIIGPQRVAGRDDFRVESGGTGQVLEGQRKFNVSVNVYADDGDDPISVADDLATSLQLPTVYELLHTKNIGVGEIRNVIDLSQLLDTKYERRAQFDFDIFVASNVIATTELIEQTIVENKILEG
jgi:hypothetical protein